MPGSSRIALENRLAPKHAYEDGETRSRQASELDAMLLDATPEEIIAAALDVAAPGRFAIVSSFGTESAVLLAAAAALDPAIPILMIDTGYLFPETLAYRDQLQERLGLRDIRNIVPDVAELASEDPKGDLFTHDTGACCALRKVWPLGKTLHDVDAWANGRKRYQGSSRSSIPIVEADGPRLKFNPLAGLSRADVVTRFRALGLPYHPLEKFGFTSVGCMPCTSRTMPGEDPRAGRWRGRGRVECGLHSGAQALSMGA